jgi:mono/diheme cytochrome c family protein
MGCGRAGMADRKTIGSALAGAAAMLLLLVVLAVLVVYTGAYNIAATEEHRSITRWALDTTFHKSIQRGAAEVSVPDEIGQDLVEVGASHYKDACQTCHGGPGAERAEWANGMRPRPPHLAEKAAERELSEIFWLVKHGARMTGMPAFGPHHDDQTLWGISAFVKELPGMTRDAYERAGADGGANHQH